MLLETIKSLVFRSKKHKGLTTQAQPISSPIKPSAPTSDHIQSMPPDNTYTDPESAPNPSIRPEQRLPVAPNAGLFQYAHHFIVNNPTMLTQVINSGGTVLQFLIQKRIPGAEVDSSARDPPPKCHPETRRSLRGRIVRWAVGAHRHWRMLWILGPPGVGKSAVAQTIAEEMKASGRLGASLFFSRINHRDDPDGVIPTLAYQLAVKCPEYKRVITERFADDPTILEKSRRTQFKELIIDPFQIIMTRNSQIIREPLLIIIDGLDECESKEAQCEFIELISDHVRQVDEFPLLWMICSRPEWHLKGMLSQPDFEVTCKREELLIDDGEAQQDVARVLQPGFQEICQRYRDRLEVDWPHKAHLRQISVTSSGLFAFASTVVKFVGDKYRNDPEGQLGVCIRFIGGYGTPGAVNPLHALDLLYRQILSDVPKDILSTTMRILGLSVLFPGAQLPAQLQANFLLLDRSTFYRSLQQLHSVVDIPPADDALHHRLHFYHTSFGDYLVDQSRSGSFSINRPAVRLDVAIHSLKWHGGSLRAAETKDTYSASFPKLEWAHYNQEQEVFVALRVFSWRLGCRTCSRVSEADAPRVVAELEDFDFRGVARNPPKFVDFLTWLYKLGDKNDSLIQLTEGGTPRGKGAVLVEHRLFTGTGMDDFMSVFGRARGTGHEEPLHLQLGRAGKSCNIVLKILPAVVGEGELSDTSFSE